MIANKNTKPIYSAPALSSRDSELIASLERERRTVVTLDELAARFGRPAAYEIVRSLVAKGVLHRVDRGLYRAQPMRSLGRRHAVSAPVTAAHILRAQPYYLGGWWAWSFHGLTEQAHTSRLDAFVTRWRAPRRVENARLFFHRVATDQLSYGIVSTNIEGSEVRVSDPERTLLDALDHPSLLGSVSDALQRVIQAQAKADVRRIVSYAARGSRTSTCQRLAVVLERRGVSPRALSPLVARTQETKSVLSLWPDAPRIGPIHAKWRVVENDVNAGR